MSQITTIWPPVLSNIASYLQKGESLVLVFSPYIKSEAIALFLDTFPSEKARVIVRWKIEDILAGASDLEVFDILQERGISLYIHQDIHLKLFEFSSGIAYAGSSNITNKGLSLQQPYNQEMGVLFTLDLNSYSNMRRLCDESRKVTKEIVEAYKTAIDNSQFNPAVVGQLVLPPIEEKDFLISELPACDSPEAFLVAAANYIQNKIPCPKMFHDIGTYKLNYDELTSANLEKKLIAAFQNQCFTKIIVDKIRKEQFMKFGAVTAFVHDLAQDVPLPYRSSIKESISRLYQWLTYCFEDLSWSVPGAHSQVIKSSRFK
jgi:hypothetical protein